MRLLRVLAISVLAIGGGGVLIAACGRGRSAPTWDEPPVGNADNLYPNNEDCYKCHANRNKLTQTESGHRQGIVGTGLKSQENKS